MGLRRGAAAWGCAGARHGAVKGRSSMGLRSVGLSRGAARGCTGAQRGAAQGRSSVGRRRGAARGCAAT